MSEPIVPSPLTIIEPPAPVGSAVSVPETVRAAAARVLAADGREFILQPWQVAYLVATTEGRERFVPQGCGVGKGWLQARLDEAIANDGR